MTHNKPQSPPNSIVVDSDPHTSNLDESSKLSEAMNSQVPFIRQQQSREEEEEEEVGNKKKKKKKGDDGEGRGGGAGGMRGICQNERRGGWPYTHSHAHTELSLSTLVSYSKYSHRDTLTTRAKT